MINIIVRNSKIYNAITDVIYDMFDGKIELEEPRVTRDQFVDRVNEYLAVGKVGDKN